MHIVDLLHCARLAERSTDRANQCTYAVINDHTFIHELLVIFALVFVVSAYMAWRLRRRWTLAGVLGGVTTLSAVGLLSSGVLFWMNNRPLPSNTHETLFDGITYIREVHDNPRQMIVHVLRIDLETPGLRFLVTPPTPTDGYSQKARTTSEFLTEYDLQIAVNAGGFYPWHSSTPWDYYPHRGDGVEPDSLTASEGVVYAGENRPPAPTMFISPDNRIAFGRRDWSTPIYNALSGLHLLVWNGRNTLADQVLNYEPAVAPRTAYGIDQSGRTLIILVVDGRQPHYSEGVTLAELGDLMLSYGIYTGVNMDGGGSSTLVMQGADGKPDVLNSPIHTRIPGRERPVATHLGIYVDRAEAP